MSGWTELLSRDYRFTLLWKPGNTILACTQTAHTEGAQGIELPGEKNPSESDPAVDRISCLIGATELHFFFCNLHWNTVFSINDSLPTDSLDRYASCFFHVSYLCAVVSQGYFLHTLCLYPELLFHFCGISPGLWLMYHLWTNSSQIYVFTPISTPKFQT